MSYREILREMLCKYGVNMVDKSVSVIYNIK